MLPTPSELTADALSDWIAKNPDPDVGGVRILPDLKTVMVYWKGAPPAGLRNLAVTLPMPVTFQASPYSLADLDPIARKVLADNRDVVSSTGPSHDYSGVSVTLWSTAPLNATIARLNKEASVPIIFDKTADPVDLAGTTDTSDSHALDECVEPARCADVPRFFGGGMIRVRGLTPSWSRVCSTGVALYAGTHQYMTTAAHCLPSGTWVSYDNGEVLGSVNQSIGHYKPDPGDIMIIETPNLFRIWNGAWNTDISQPVTKMKRPAEGVYVAVSAGVSGNNAPQRVESVGRYWSTETAESVGPGFFVEPHVTDRIWGYVQKGDSGSPVIRSDSAGNFEVQGFLSKGQNTVATPTNCSPLRHPGFPPTTSPPSYCYGDYWAVYADIAINSYVGVHLKTVSDQGP
ncbi:hypothetical protein [Kribbella sp. NPDC000426]|uniref:hypothetical protein n=1 Tax=Kribbella sp. NPDC000426 TaxID=3154255 RepID=UPI0033272910